MSWLVVGAVAVVVGLIDDLMHSWWWRARGCPNDFDEVDHG